MKLYRLTKAEKLLSAVAILFGVAGFIILLFFLISLWQSDYSIALGDKLSPSTSGVVGDFIGGVIGSLWAFTGVILFVLALQLQRKELNEQIKEMTESRIVSEKQKFENVFFNMLRVQERIANSYAGSVLRRFEPDGSLMKPNKWGGFTDRVEGREFLRHVSDEIKGLISILIRVQNTGFRNEEELSCLNMYGLHYHKNDPPRYTAEDALSICYPRIFERYNDILAHYFRHLFHIINHVSFTMNQHIAAISDEEEISLAKEYYKHFVKLIQAQMSASELFLFFCNGHFFEKTEELINEFEFLDNLAKEDFPDSTLENLYPKLRFKSRAEIFGNLLGKPQKKSIT